MNAEYPKASTRMRSKPSLAEQIQWMTSKKQETKTEWKRVHPFYKDILQALRTVSSIILKGYVYSISYEEVSPQLVKNNKTPVGLSCIKSTSRLCKLSCSGCRGSSGCWATSSRSGRKKMTMLVTAFKWKRENSRRFSHWVELTVQQILWRHHRYPIEHQ